MKFSIFSFNFPFFSPFEIISVYDFGKPYGESCYRLMSRTGQFIYLRTRGFLDVDEDTRQVHSFVCVNTLMSEEEGRQLVKEMKKKFSAIISEAELEALESDIPTVENPNNLEHAILNLITNLNNPAICGDDEQSLSDSSSTANTVETVDKKLPLAIIPPEPDTIKTSITRAADVISYALKPNASPKIKDEPRSPEPSTHGDVGRAKNSCKMEPLSNVMSSPSSTSPMSSNDPLSPFSSSASSSSAATSSSSTTTCIPPTNTTTYSISNEENQRKCQPQSTSTLLHEAAATISVITSTGDSGGSNNSNMANTSKRSSVLKRTHSRDDGDYTETSIKKRVVVDVSNFKDNSLEFASNIEQQSLDLLESADTGLYLTLSTLTLIR